MSMCPFASAFWDLPTLGLLYLFLLHSLRCWGSTSPCLGACGLYFTCVSLRKVTKFPSSLYCFCPVFRRRKWKMLIGPAISQHSSWFLFIVVTIMGRKRGKFILSLLFLIGKPDFGHFKSFLRSLVFKSED